MEFLLVIRSMETVGANAEQDGREIHAKINPLAILFAKTILSLSPPITLTTASAIASTAGKAKLVK